MSLVKSQEACAIRSFTASVVSSLEAAGDIGLTPQAYHDLVESCEDALGNDIEIKFAGSLTRGTAAVQDTDIDIQVRRSRKTGQRDKPFTDDDKQRVARKLKKSPCVTGPVTVGRVAIKFKMENRLHVDLVLWMPRLEEFPRLRGGRALTQILSSSIHFCRSRPQREPLSLE